MLRFICGEIKLVSAHLDYIDQNFEKEDAIAIAMQFENHAVGTFFLSDRTPSPWSWEFALGENLALPKTGQNPIRFLGSKGALEFPNLVLWQHSDAFSGHWQNDIIPQPIETEFIDAYIAQIRHPVEVVQGKTAPLITARDASLSLKATIAVAQAAEAGHQVEIDYAQIG